jgi:predicted PurR-regulated permease PerM
MTDPERREAADAQTIALRIVVGLLLVGGAWLLAGLLVPFLLALILAIALAPLAARLERAGVPKGAADLLCLLVVVAVLAATIGLLVYETGTVLKDSDRYLKRFSELIARGARRTGGDRLVESLGLLRSEGEGREGRARPGGSDRPESRGDEGRGEGTGGPGAAWFQFLRRNVISLARWVGAGLGGVLGFVGGLAIFLVYLFYMLATREEWVERITHAARRLGLRPNRERLARVQHEVVTYVGCLSLVCLAYAVLVSLALWAIGVPQPLMWGVLAGLLEFVPYLGPLIACVLPTIVSLSLGTWWQPAAVLGVFVGLHLIDAYVVTPILYGRAVHLDPVTLLFGALFFGWIWGPFGLALGTPMLILLRGLLVMAPDTPALDALADVEDQKAASAVAR